MVRKMIGFIPLQMALEKVECNIMKGESLKWNGLFDNRIISLVKVDEETNQTEYIFNQLNEQYNQELTQQYKIISTALDNYKFSKDLQKLISYQLLKITEFEMVNSSQKRKVLTQEQMS